METCKQCVSLLAAAKYGRNTLPFLYLLLTLSPVFGLVELYIDEEKPLGSFVGNIPSEAQLGSKYSMDVLRTLRYVILRDQQNTQTPLLFEVEEVSGILKTSSTQTIDRENNAICPPQTLTCSYLLDIVVSPREYFEIINVQINIVDTNDNNPVFSQTVLYLQIPELSSPQIYREKLPLATDQDSGNFGVKRYELLVSDGDKFVVEITTQPNGIHTPWLVLANSLNREDVSFYKLKLAAYDGGTPPKVGYLDIEITVEDGNDNSPIFINTTYNVDVQENSAINTTIVTVKALDADIGVHAQIRYNFGAGSEQHLDLFGIKPKTGEIYLKGNLDYEKQSSYQLLVSAEDMGPNSQPAFATINVNVKDLNDNAPRITVNSLNDGKPPQVSEFDGEGTFVAYVSVTDPDAGSNGEFTCDLDTTLFDLQKLKATQYTIVTAAEFDREVEREKEFTITCYDFGDPGKMTSRTVIVAIQDENDNIPVFTKTTYTFETPENNVVDSFIGIVNASDQDSGENGKVVYRLEGNMADLFDIKANTGEITSKIIFDYETVREFMFSVVAHDSSLPEATQQSATATIMVTVIDRNDEPPMFSQSLYIFYVLENQPIGMEIGKVSATDPDSIPFNYFEFSLAPSTAAQMFAVDTTTGHLRTKATLDRETKSSYQLTVIATNVGVTPVLSSSALITVNVRDENDNAPIIDFPSAHNHTLQVSGHTPRGQDVAFVLATDLDEGENAILTYAITHGNKDNTFAINPSNGVIKTDRDLKGYGDGEFRLTVSVTDHGFPQKTVDAVLHVIVNSSLVFGNGSRGGKLIGGTNLTIVIALTVSSVVIIVILVVAIVMTKMQDNKNKGNQYRYRIEGMKVWSNSMKKHKNEDAQSLENGATGDKRSPKKEVNFSLADESQDSHIQDNNQVSIDKS